MSYLRILAEYNGLAPLSPGQAGKGEPVGVARGHGGAKVIKTSL